MRCPFRHFIRVCLTLELAVIACSVGAQGLSYPVTARGSATDVFHGIPVSEDYRWLEAVDTPPVRHWVEQQNLLTRSVLDKLPQRPAIAAELAELMGKAPVTRRGLQFVAGRLFALKKQPPANQPKLVVLANPTEPAGERVLLDPDQLTAKGTTAIDWYVPSLDGKTVAVSLSDNGSEEGTLHLFDVASGHKLPDVLPRVQSATGGGSVAWAAGNRGLFYTRYPQGNERAAADANFFQQVWFHKLGTSADEDTYIIGKDFPRIAEIALSSTLDGRYLLADVANGDGGEHAFYLRSPKGRWNRIADYSDGVRSIVLGRDGRWYAVVLKGSPRGRVVAASLDAPVLGHARTVVAEGEQVVAGLTPTQSRLYIEYLAGGPTELRSFTLAGRPLGRIGRIGNAAIATVYVGAALQGDSILFGSQSFVKPFAWYLYSPSRQRPDPSPVATVLSEAPATAKLDDVEVLREFATSRDGTKIPLNIVRRRGTPLDGSSPTLLTGYGGYGVSMQPYYAPSNAFWLQHGGVFVLANLRGGGEFGEDWHTAGNLTRKQNVFDDFLAGAQHLIDKRYTSPDRLAIEGGSNGGLLMGAALVQRPELFKAVVSHVGIYDMLRFELSPNGEFNVTEFGSVKDPAQFQALLAYSPYHHVVDGTAYPTVLLLTGLHDGRVEPYQSLKMAARLQAVAGAMSGKPILLRVDGDAGHGQGMALGSAIEQQADVFAFLFDALGMK